MESYLFEWIAFLVRWLHLIAGIAWIGSSFYFVWLDNHLQPPPPERNADPGVYGELWAVHGGGFYHSQKYRVAPPVLPATLHWFKWEAYTTWLSGFGLLSLLYLVRAEAYLTDPSVAMLSKPLAIVLALAALVASWLVYDGLCRSALVRRPRSLALVIAGLLAVLAWGLCQLFSGRGAFMIFGAAIGTIMVANVFFVIIPGQGELVRAKREGREPDPAAGLRGKLRSVHNTYFTLPVLFVMISNHFALTYGARYNWLVLIAMSLAGALIRAWFVARHKAAERGGRTPALPLVLGLLILAAVILALAPWGGAVLASTPGTSPATRVEGIVAQRCAPCHAQRPTQPGFASAPNGVVLERLDQLRIHLPQIQQQLTMRAMPLGNLTAMSEEERATLLQWVRAAAAPTP